MTTAIEPSAEEIELKPCPFCGEHLVHSPDLSTRTSKIFVHPETAHYCVVEHVMISTAGGGHRVVAWNRRAEVVGEPAPQLSGNTGELPAPAVAVPEAAIDALADRFWRVHPREIQDSGLTRAEWYAARMKELLAAATQPPATRSYAPSDEATRDQIAAVMLLHGTPDQQREAAEYAGVQPPATRSYEEGRDDGIEAAASLVEDRYRKALDEDELADWVRSLKGPRDE
ncbi:hypothetical protein [Kaistia sp. MMO-174]|uniref:hypothetical protein n=1 Tax=Kaistia sp. MMO-174 TaxID=3081256 RepID=UPI00301A4821